MDIQGTVTIGFMAPNMACSLPSHQRLARQSLIRHLGCRHVVWGLSKRSTAPAQSIGLRAAVRCEAKESGKSSTRGARHLCSLTDRDEQILAHAGWMLPELLTGRRITRLLGTPLWSLPGRRISLLALGPLMPGGEFQNPLPCLIVGPGFVFRGRGRGKARPPRRLARAAAAR